MITEVLIGLTVIALAVIFFYFFPYIFLQAIGLIPYIAYKQLRKNNNRGKLNKSNYKTKKKTTKKTSETAAQKF